MPIFNDTYFGEIKQYDFSILCIDRNIGLTLILVVHIDSSDWLNRSYITQCCCGYCKLRVAVSVLLLRYAEDTLQPFQQKLQHVEAAEYPSIPLHLLQLASSCSNHSHSGTLYENYVAG